MSSVLGLTVGVPVYNAMPFLPETVDSLLRQTFSDFELLIVDDGSTDGSREYLGTINDSRLRLISQPNQGLSATLNRMLREAKGTWLIRQDADDIAYPQRLSLIAEAVRRHPDSGMFYSLADQLPRAPGRGPFRTTVGEPQALRAITRAGYLLAICHSTVVLNIDKTLDVGGYQVELQSAQDKDLWWRMALSHDIRLIPEKTLAYRLSASGLSNSDLLGQAAESMFSQYLLLSALWGLPTQPFRIARPILAEMIDAKELQCRGHLRQSAIAYGHRQTLSALGHAMLAGLAAPRYLLKRVYHQLSRAAFHRSTNIKRPEVSGIDPIFFAAKLDALWP